jgi:ubiquinol-cytochrome c reductase cytochrome b subunit
MFIAAFLPWLDTSPIKSGNHRPLYKILFFIFVADFVFLTILGKLPPNGLYAWLGFAGSLVYFAFFFALPIISRIEKKKLEGGR